VPDATGQSTHGYAGPEALLGLKAEYLIPCAYHFYQRPPQLVRGEGCYLFDDTGKRYLDAFAGVTVMNCGHANPAIIEPAIAQIRTLQHTTSIYLTEPVLRLAERLAGIAPGQLCRSFFTASGTEAVEGALLLAALHTRRPRVVAFKNSLHGRTRWAMNVTGAPMWRTDPYPSPLVEHMPFGDLDALEHYFSRYGPETSALVGEPIQGNGGVNEPPPGYWASVRELCDRHGVLLVFDEVQTGMNRAGSWFACTQHGVTPDILTISKALGNGFPIAAFITTDAIAQSYTRPGASTHGGNPVSAAAALAVIDYHEQHDLGRAAIRRGQQLHAGLTELRQLDRTLGRPRGRGLMVGVPVIDPQGQPDGKRCDHILESLKDRGVLAGKTGPGRNVLTFLPPLVIGMTQIGDLLDVLENTLNDINGAAGARRPDRLPATPANA